MTERRNPLDRNAVSVWDIGFYSEPPPGVEFEEFTGSASVIDGWAKFFEDEIDLAKCVLKILGRRMSDYPFEPGSQVVSASGRFITEEAAREYLAQMEKGRRTPERQRLLRVRIK